MIVHEINLSPSTIIRISKDVVNDKTFGQVRVWVKPKNADEFLPTKKGVAFDLSKTGELVEGLLSLEEHTEGGEA
jgi:hypothetical protein